MPPRKKARLSTTASPAPPDKTAEPSPEELADAEEAARDAEFVQDPWTDDEEIGLFKGLVRFKPTGTNEL